MAFKYEIVKVGQAPTWDKQRLETFQNPVSVGDKVKASGTGGELLLVMAVEHYPDCSVLYHA